MASANPVIQVQGLVKQFGALTAVDDVSFEVQPGEVFGILGPNGAGKTTTLECIEGLTDPTAGRTLVLGMETHRETDLVKQRIGVQLQASAYFDYLTLRKILRLFGRFYSRRIPPDDLLAKVELMDKADSTVAKLSGGQKQRFTIAATLVNNPEVVFLDEPTTGLDPQARHNLWEFIRSIHDEGRTVVLTTHYMEEAGALCQRVAIMDRAKIVALDTPANLVRGLPVPYKLRVVLDGDGPVRAGLPGPGRRGGRGRRGRRRLHGAIVRRQPYGARSAGAGRPDRAAALPPGGAERELGGRVPYPHRPDAQRVAQSPSSKPRRRGRPCSEPLSSPT